MATYEDPFDRATRGTRAVARFRGEEAANFVRGALAVALVLTDHPYAGLFLACVVLSVAPIVRQGEARMPFVVLTTGIDTIALTWGLSGMSPDRGPLLACAIVAVLLSATRQVPGLVVACGVFAQMASHAVQVMSRGVIHPSGARPLAYPMAAAAVGVLVACAVWALRRRREKRFVVPHVRGTPPLVETPGYRAPAAVATPLRVCGNCHAPVVSETRCWLCTESFEATPPIEDGSRVVSPTFDARKGARMLVATMSLAATALGLSFAWLLREAHTALNDREAMLVIVSPSVFVVLVLVPVLAYLRTGGARRGEILTSARLHGVVGTMLNVVLGLATLVLVVTGLAVVATAICSGFTLLSR